MSRERGFTLIEVILALSILLVVMMMLASTTGRALHTAATTQSQQTAIQLVMDKIDQVRNDPNYDGLESAYAKTDTTFTGLPGFRRVTSIVRTGGQGQPNDYKKITVVVTGPGITPVSRSVTVAAP
jgi:prepilin-type N-terminal cleavage/methylation domain-containing protein